MNIRIATVGLAHPFEIGYEKAFDLMQETANSLEAVGVTCMNTNVVLENLETVYQAVESLKNVDADVLMICIATWSEDHHLLDLLSFVEKPVILRAYPARDTGSLCCAHQIGAVFTDIGKKYEFVFGKPDSMDCAKKAKRVATSYSLIRCMNQVRVGAIGGRVKGMTEIAYDEFSIKKKLGARIINIDEKEILDKVKAISDDEAMALLQEKEPLLRPCKVTSTKESMLESMKFYGALRELVQEYALDALSVKCYTAYMGKVCLAYSILAEEGIVASCEGDVTNAVTMKLLYELSGMPVNNTDLLDLYDDENCILFAHCGSSGFSIAEGEVELAPVRLAETGVCSKFLVKPGTVTAVNICGHGEQLRMAVMVGEAVSCGMDFPGNPAKIRFNKSIHQMNQEIVEQGVGHHWMIGYGNYAEELRNFCRINEIKLYEI